MLTAITRGVSASLATGELTYRDRTPIDIALARRQHEAYERVLTSLGVLIDHLPAEDALADAVFVEDVAMVLDEIAIVTTPGAVSRRGETESIARAVGKYRPVKQLALPATLDGGDVVRIGKTLYVGLSSRTNTAGIDQLGALVSPLGYTVLSVEVAGALHLKTACTYAGRGILLANPEWAATNVFRDVEILPVDQAEPWGGSVLAIGDHLVMAASFPRTRAKLEARGFIVDAVDLSELQKAEGGPTCLSIVFDASDA
ncbi:MAG TPA: N(G),N(G)-dimethylarginine dimethylaminohydrolase [Gemmatimonadaceae bacterium]|nr:N(G),N(G)-dimethylarginine dimethylaminohydrolase [Gemmatimonadaceae bacterium]